MEPSTPALGLQPLGASAAPVTLRGYLREGHQSVFPEGSLVDAPCEEISPDRIQWIVAQLVAQATLGRKLREPGLLPPGVPPAQTLPEMIAQAEAYRLVTRKQAGVLMQVNREANEAKHGLHF